MTFLLTDVEGATTLLDRHAEAATTALDRHEALIREVVQVHDGVVFSFGGDNFIAAFGDPKDALAAALEAQRRQLLEPVGEAGPLKVRMAIHSGPAVPHNGSYRSPSVYRVSRLGSIVRGGQVLLTQVGIGKVPLDSFAQDL